MTKHQPYKERLGHPHDFEVDYRILTENEGGRKTLPFQGIRWDFWYAFNDEHKGQLFMIWPEFINIKGEVITENNVHVPASGKASMWIINNSLRKYHQNKIKIGLNANGHEGGTVVAKYIVTKIVGLMTNPTEE